MIRRHLILFVIIWVIFVPTSSVASVQLDQSKLTLTATTTIIADALTHIVGPTATINTMMASGVDPHDYEPTPMDLISVNNSDYIFWIGRGVEEGLEGILQFWGDQGKALSLLDSLPDEDLIMSDPQDEEDNGVLTSINPHFWLDPILWAKAISAITEILIEINPEDQMEYISNNQSYQEHLSTLHSDLFAKSLELTPEQRFLVTPHNSFPYFAHRYDFNEMSLGGISTETQAGIQEIDQLALFLKENNISVVFTEITTPSDSLEAVVDAARAMGHAVAIGGELSAGSLTTQLQSYFQLMDYNMNTIVENTLSPPDIDNLVLSFNWFFLSAILLLSFRRRS